MGIKVVIVDKFLNNIKGDKFTPITEIFNITDINIFLKKNYDIIIVDKNHINFEILSIIYGTETKNIDLTDCIISQFYKNKKLYINANNCILNNIKGDPCPGEIKKVFFKYKMNDYVIEEIYGEYLDRAIVIDFDSPYNFNFGWITSFNNNMFEKILTNIQYNNDFVLKSKLALKDINMDTKINVIHLRLEDDGIEHWSVQNNMTQNNYKTYLEEKYINLIEKHFSKTDYSIILSHSHSNGVIDFLTQHNFTYKFVDKFFGDREMDAIVDLLVSSYCNNIYIGNFNIERLSGSTFSYYIGKCMKNPVTKIYIDLDRICDKECIDEC
jgi:hypothetical protein